MLGDHVRAVQHAHHALTAATHSRDLVTLGRAHYVLALEDYWAGQPQQGIEHGRQAIALLEQTAERESLGMAYFYVALNLTLLGDFAPALAAVAQAQALGAALGDPGLQSYAAWLTGCICTMQGDGARGIALAQQSLTQSPHPLNTALALSVWGYACLEQGDAVQAISLLERLVQHTDQMQYQRLQGFVIPLLGEAHGMCGHLETARDLVSQGLDISQRVTYRPGVGVAQRALGRIAQRRGALVEAERYLQEACATFAAMSARYELGRTHLDLAALGQSRDDVEAAATHLTEAYALFTALHLPQYAARTAQLASVLGVALRRGDQEPG